MVSLDDGVDVAGLRLRNRLYRAPLLECAGDGPDAGERLADELEPAAAAGAGLVVQGATVVAEEGGCVAPNMTRLADDAAVERLRPVTDAVHAHGGRIVVQLDHGGLRSLETWHREYGAANPYLSQLAVSRPPRLLRALDRLGALDYDPHVLSTEEAYDVAADFGRAARRAVEAGYDGVHLAGGNMGLLQQFCSPYYNRRDDEFADPGRFLEVVHDEVRDRAGDVPLLVKLTTESRRPPFVRRGIERADVVHLAERLADHGYDAVSPVEGSVFWDASLVRGEHPERAWAASQFESGYAAAFGGRTRAALVRELARASARLNPFEACWNADLCRAVREAVDIPVLCEGGIRTRTEMDALLGDACDLVGLARPFYAEPRLPARLLGGGDEVVCENCNNCVVPQATGAPGMCRTPSVLRERGAYERAGAYDTPSTPSDPE
ncbi:NADH:flavin oxidoreductase [Halomarina ordinaria]|uniref:NADH:flavin oxidoreductase n=1 Tax=Halomarina ordinaria TaxID=3033939 RepID=A0ABD5U5V1_9EURY|nr:NADH:flavin oxidoreductase [Halomarina sp. PSRA2]